MRVSRRLHRDWFGGAMIVIVPMAVTVVMTVIVRMCMIVSGHGMGFSKRCAQGG